MDRSFSSALWLSVRFLPAPALNRNPNLKPVPVPVAVPCTLAFVYLSSRFTLHSLVLTVGLSPSLSQSQFPLPPFFSALTLLTHSLLLPFPFAFTPPRLRSRFRVSNPLTNSPRISASPSLRRVSSMTSSVLMVARPAWRANDSRSHAVVPVRKNVRTEKGGVGGWW